MRYVSVNDPEVRAELMSDLSGLVVGSAFLLNSIEQVEGLLQRCELAAKAEYDRVATSGLPPDVSCLSIDAGGVIGFDSLVTIADLLEDSVLVPVYRYFDTPRETIVAAALAAPSQIKKTSQVTFFCGPDRRKTGDYRIFSLHPGPKRQLFPNRYQPEAVRKQNREFWDRHAFYTTPNQLIATKVIMQERAANLEQEARDRVYYMARNMSSALHRWYGTWENVKRPDDVKSMMEGIFAMGEYGMATNGTVYYFISEPSTPRPDLNNFAIIEPRLSNVLRPCIIRPDGGEEYYLEGKRHREGGPALLTPTPDGGWMEVWYEDGVISRNPEDGPAKTIYSATGEVLQEIAIYQGAEVQTTVLGVAAEPVKLLQEQIKYTSELIEWFEESRDMQLIRSQIEFAANRSKIPLDKVVRQMQPKDEQTGLRWDFDHMLEQDDTIKERYNGLVLSLSGMGTVLMEASRAMNGVEGDINIINGIWAKINRELDRIIERCHKLPGDPGKTMGDDFAATRAEAKKIFQSLADGSKMFSATGK